MPKNMTLVWRARGIDVMEPGDSRNRVLMYGQLLGLSGNQPVAMYGRPRCLLASCKVHSHQLLQLV